MGHAIKKTDFLMSQLFPDKGPAAPPHPGPGSLVRAALKRPYLQGLLAVCRLPQGRLCDQYGGVLMLPSAFLQDEGPDVLHALPVEDAATLDGVAKGVGMENVDAETQAPPGVAGAGVLPARAVVHDAREDHLWLVPARQAGLHKARPVVDDDGSRGHG